MAIATAWAVSFKLSGFIAINEILSERLINVANMRFVQTVAQWLSRDELESIFQARETTSILGMEEIDCEPFPRCRDGSRRNVAQARVRLSEGPRRRGPSG